MNARLVILIIVCQILALIIPNGTNAQSFIALDYSGTAGSYYHDVTVLTNGNYVCTGIKQTATTGTSYTTEIITTIYSPTGQQIRQMVTLGPGDDSYGIVATTDGGFAIAGSRTTTGGTVGDFIITRFNSAGDILWSRPYPSSFGTPDDARSIKQLADGGFIAVGSARSSSNRKLYVLRIDAQGFKVWDFAIGGPNSMKATDVVLTHDNNYMVTGIIDTIGFQSTAFALKLDTSGNNLWYKTYKGFAFGTTVKAVESPDNNFIIMNRHVGGSPGLLVLNAQGDSINHVIYSDTMTGQRIFRDIVLNADSSYSLTGFKNINGKNHLWLLTLDQQLDTVWSKVYRDSSNAASSYQGRGIIQTSDKGFAIVGTWGGNGVLLKTDSLGNIKTSLLLGNVVFDGNANCNRDAGETLMPNNLIQVTTANGNVFYGHSNFQGKYQINTSMNGPADVSLIGRNSYWQSASCQSINIPITLQHFDTVVLDLYAEPAILCPKLEVNIFNSVLRRCFSTNAIYVNYCNQGTVTANNAYVEITFDQFLEVTQSSLPWTSVSGETYTFNLGNVAAGACGSFFVNVTVNCDSTVLGQAHCVEAHIYPDSICEPIEPSWDLSSLTLVSQCLESDSVRFTITNVGTGNMSSPSSYTIVENTTIILQVPFQLNAGETLEILLPGNGSTYTLTVPQSTGHPGLSAPLSAVEGCGRDNQNNFSIGFLTQFPQDDENDFIDIFCTQNQGAYDPNQKTAEPQGIGSAGFINATRLLDYTIQFQNTGTDTAFTVILVDTLPPSLDITTLGLTGASHEYTFQIIDSNILEWTFANILLPDSNVNEPLSHGFASFKINQKPGNSPGTQIRNRAGIYFDYNEPVITNYTINTIVDDYKTELETSVSIKELNNKANALKLYPNPNTGQFYIELLEPTDSELSIAIFDLAGKQVSQNTFVGNGPHLVDVENLGAGMYFYTLTQGAESIGNGKLLVDKH